MEILLIIVLIFGLLALIQSLIALFATMTTFVLAATGGAIAVIVALGAFRKYTHELKMTEIRERARIEGVDRPWIDY